MRIIIHSTVILFSTILGCSNPVTHIRTTEPPTQKHNTQNDPILVRSSLDATWDRLLSKIMTSQFKIHNIDSKSHIISLTSSGDPKNYVDCGSKMIESEGQTTNVINSARKYSYLVHRLNHNDTYQIANQFKGKVVVYVSGNGLQSKVLLKFYIELISDQDIKTTQGTLHSKSSRYKLTLRGYERKRFKAFDSFCQSTGKLEKEARALVQTEPVH